jgi:hypothetical protein
MRHDPRRSSRAGKGDIRPNAPLVTFGVVSVDPPERWVRLVCTPALAAPLTPMGWLRNRAPRAGRIIVMARKTEPKTRFIVMPSAARIGRAPVAMPFKATRREVPATSTTQLPSQPDQTLLEGFPRVAVLPNSQRPVMRCRPKFYRSARMKPSRSACSAASSLFMASSLSRYLRHPSLANVHRDRFCRRDVASFGVVPKRKQRIALRVVSRAGPSWDVITRCAETKHKAINIVSGFGNKVDNVSSKMPSRCISASCMRMTLRVPYMPRKRSS